MRCTPRPWAVHWACYLLTLVVDDFAGWSSSKSMQHFLRTLRELYTIKVDFQGLKYLGITIDICRSQRHATLSMPGYVAKLLKRVRPNGIKGAATPSVYASPNYSHPATQKATVDTTSLASDEQQKELQVVVGTLLYIYIYIVVGTLLYYARTVDPSILTSVHELGSVQAKPTLNDMRKSERLLQLNASKSWSSISRVYYAVTSTVGCLVLKPTKSTVCNGGTTLPGYHRYDQWSLLLHK
jgi:hypothetical protein